MSDTEIKVTDKRMFTPDGRLREEYRFLEEKLAAAAEAGPPAAEAPATTAPEPAAEERAPAAARPPGEPAGAPPLELPGTPPGLGGPSFLDLVQMMAEPVAIYLGDAPLPGGDYSEDLEMAGLHIDLLEILREKTVGNLDRQEAAVLEEILYRLRMRYVQKRG